MSIRHPFPLSRRHMLQAGLAAAAMAPFVMPRLSLADYSEGDVPDGRTLSGTVKLNGKLPPDTEILISKDEHVCGSGHAISDPVKTDADGRLAMAVVALSGITAGKPWPETSAAPTIIQEACRFSPFVQVAPKGAELTIHNKDPLLHNIHAYELIGRARRSLFNIAQPQADQIDKATLKLRRGDIVELDCDAHNWMSAWVYTSENPYLAVTGADGAFMIDQIPPGTYEATIWHPGVDTAMQEITITPDEDLNLDLTLSPVDA